MMRTTLGYINTMLTLIFLLVRLVDFTSAVIEIKVGVPLITNSGAPYDIERVGPAIDIAIERVNSDLLNDSYRIVKVERRYGNDCSTARVPGIVADLHYKEDIVALFGPACSVAVDVAAKMANYWNIPLVTGYGDSGLFVDKTDYPTLTRFAYCQCQVRQVFGSVFVNFGWRDIAMIYDVNDAHSNVLATSLKVGLQKQDIYPHLFDYYGKPDTKRILQRAAAYTRVILLIVPGDRIREFLLEAFDLGYVQTGEFVFMDVELFPFPGDYYGNHDWRRGDARDDEAKEAFTSLLRVALNEPTHGEWLNFTKRVKEQSLANYNHTYGTEKVNFFVGAFHDAVLAYGVALNESLEAGETDLYLDGYSFARRLWNRTFPGVTGPVIIDESGDRETSYSILDMDPGTGNFRVVANYGGDRHYYDPILGVPIHWAGGRTTPPENEPRCGFTGDKDICKAPETIPGFIIVLIVCFVALILVLIAGIVAYRHYQREKAILSMSWLVPYKDLKGIKGGTGMSRTSLPTSLGRSVEDVQSSIGSCRNQQLFTTVALYKGSKVALKKLSEEKVELTRDLLLEMKQLQDMTNGNLTRFIGACVEPGIFAILTEYCSKGSLQDVILNESIKLDWIFRTALLKDIVSGLKYIHKSEMRFHGRLKSSNCVVDGRFVVKLTDFGLSSFYCKKEKTNVTHANREKLLWRAPELLRAQTKRGSQEGDIYSLGIIIGELVNRAGPFELSPSYICLEDTIARIIAHEDPAFRPKMSSSDCPAGIKAMALACWQDDPARRPTIDEVKHRVTQLAGGKRENLMETLLERMEQYAGNLEQIVEERTQQLEVEKRKSEALLYQILPKSVAEQLRSGQHVIPEAFDSVTIYFSDIVGFTALSSESTPLEVVDLLNDLYTVCDSVIDNYDVYKVETIGDAYMVVSGLPVRNGIDHAANICRMALSFLQHLQTFEVRHRPGYKLQLRSGIHSGPCVAGVVGLKMPRYCLFGDTVNTASRMESNGEAQKVHISSDTWTILKNFPSFRTEYRGQITAKGKGTISTYWLLEED